MKRNELIIIDNFDYFLRKINNETKGIYVWKDCGKYLSEKTFAIMFFVFTQRKYRCSVIELGSYNIFNDKDVSKKCNHLEQFSKEFGAKIPFVTDYYMCCFNQNDKEKICEGFKGEFDLNHVMTGKELCDILKIDYMKIVEVRRQDAKDNFEYFLSELFKIKEVKNFCKHYKRN